MKYIFCILAILIFIFFSWIVFFKQNKKKAALNIPILAYTGAYLYVQFWIFFKYLVKLPDKYEYWVYIVQVIILILFVVGKLLLFGSNVYINNVQNKQQQSIKDFKALIEEVQIIKVGLTSLEQKRQLDLLIEKMKYTDPVSNSTAQNINEKIEQLIEELSNAKTADSFDKIYADIEKQIDLRKIKNTKEFG